MVVPQAQGVGLRIQGTSFCIAAALAVAAASPALAQERTHVLIVSGIGGEPQYQSLFFDWGAQMAKAAVERWGVPAGDVTYLTEQPERDPALTAGRSTSEEIDKAVTRIASSAGPADVVFVLLIGHGSFQNGESRLSLPGPDLTADDFAKLIAKFGDRRVTLVNAASASGEFVKAISGPNRVVITSTKSGMERNQAKFGGYFVAAFADDGADTDKDGAVSMLEAFTYAKRETLRAYESAQTMLTEHAVLDDNGDAKGTADVTVDGAEDGALAKVTFLGRGAVVAGVSAPPGASPALRALYSEKQVLEKAVADLRALKSTMAEAAYEAELERLLVELALKNQEIRRIEGGGS